MANNRRLAVVVGINNYPDGVNKLGGAVKDAEEVCEALVNKGRFEIERESCFLTDEKATHRKIMTALSRVLKQTRDADQIIFYFAGHGFVDDYDGQFYIAPCDIDASDPFISGISMQTLKNLSLKSPANTILLLDCCYAGKVAEEGTRSGGRQLVAETYRKELLATVGSPGEEVPGAQVDVLRGVGRGKIVFASSEANQVSREHQLSHSEGEEPHLHGAFSFYLIQGLKGGAVNQDGVVTFHSLRNFVEEGMITLGKQKPIYSISGGYSPEDIRIAVINDGIFKTNSAKLAESILNALPPKGYHDIQLLHKALISTEELRKRDPSYRDLESYARTIGSEIKLHRDELAAFLARNEVPLKLEIGLEIWEDTLWPAVSSLSYERLRTISPNQLTYLNLLRREMRKQDQMHIVYRKDDGTLNQEAIDYFLTQLVACGLKPGGQ